MSFWIPEQSTVLWRIAITHRETVLRKFLASVFKIQIANGPLVTATKQVLARNLS